MLKLQSIKKIRFILTDFCNYQCKFCHNEGFKTKNSVYLDLNSILTLTKIAKKMCIKKITLTGGEPLLHKEILDIVKGIKKIYPDVLLGMSTNGMGFNENNFLTTIKYIDRLRINCQSLDDETCKFICGPAANVNKIIWIVENAKKENPSLNICLNFVLTIYNQDSLEDLIKYAIKNQIDVKVLEYKNIDKHLYVNIDLAKKVLRSLHPIKEEADYQDDDIYTFKNSKSRIRLCYSFCNTLKCESCRACGELRITPDLKFKHCFDDKIEEFDVSADLAKEDSEAIEKLIIKIDKIKGKILV